MIIGLTGSFCSGKDYVASQFIGKGLIHFSLSDYLREELGRRGVEKTRENLVNLGNELRAKHGSGVLTEKTLEKIEENKDYVISSIRSPGEIAALRKRKDFFLVWLDAPVKVRFNRMNKRQREENDPKTLKEFKKAEARENSRSKSGQQLNKCKKLANAIVKNDKTKEILDGKISKMLSDFKTLELKKKRMDWDSYFLKIAMLVAERSTCRRHHVGAVLVKDRRIIATGYNGAAAGTKDCIELGCLRDQMNIPSGTRHEICRAIHAEQNAIIQSGLHGAHTEGATMYCTHPPCNICAKMIANAKVKRVVTFSEYPDKSFIALFKEVGIKFVKKQMPERLISSLP